MRDYLVSILTCYNGLAYLPLQVAYLNLVGAKPYVIDNFSTDGSWEFLRDMGIPGTRVDTQGMFDLRILQRARIDASRMLQPEWIIYGDVDEFCLFSRPGEFIETLRSVEKAGINALRVRSFNFFNTGESLSLGNAPLQFSFCQERYSEYAGMVRVHRFSDLLTYSGDSVRFPGLSELKVSGAIMCNYGDTKPASEREVVLRRRELAWEQGLPRGFGQHYLKGAERNWKWDPSTLLDLKGTTFWSHVTSHSASRRKGSQCSDNQGVRK